MAVFPLLPFEEKFKSQGDYQARINAIAQNLWNGKIGAYDFDNLMRVAIEYGIRGAWEAGLKEFNLSLADMTMEERAAMLDAIYKESSYIAGLRNYILAHNKASGFKLSSLQIRLGMWGNRWKDIVNQARLSASNNAPLTWVYGDTISHCRDCSRVAGRTYRAKTWERWGWRPQSPRLECKGIQCKCELRALGNKPNKGRPPSLSGG